MLPKIFIGGDSWGCGEWAIDPQGVAHIVGYGVAHKGLEQYFTDANYVVVNSSTGGSSNKGSIYKLTHSLKDYKAGDIILWIQTDPIRDLRISPGNYGNNISRAFTDDFIKLEKELLNNSYSELQSIALLYNTNIFLIGGCQNIDCTEVSKFKKLTVLVKSWVSMLINQYDDENFGFVTSDWHIDNFSINALADNIKKQLVNDIHHYRKYIMKNYDIFNPDGSHPNREGHKILYNFIKKNLNL
jgi:hypothetical protein